MHNSAHDKHECACAIGIPLDQDPMRDRDPALNRNRDPQRDRDPARDWDPTHSSLTRQDPVATDRPQFLCRDKDCSVLCRDRNSMSRQGLGWTGFGWRQGPHFVSTDSVWGWTRFGSRQGPPFVAIDRAWGWTRFGSRQGPPCVTTEFPKAGPFQSRQKPLCCDSARPGRATTELVTAHMACATMRA